MARKNRCIAEAWTYVTKADRELPKDQQSRFTLSPLISTERDLLRDEMVNDDRTFGSIYTRGRKLALDHIVSVENFPVGEPKPWPEKRSEREAYLSLLDDDDVLEIGNEVWARSTLGPEDKELKNSSTPERTSASGEPSPDRTSTTAASAESSA
jgi:hypothetical protein